jgi:hypothetical protein
MSSAASGATTADDHLLLMANVHCYLISLLHITEKLGVCTQW